MTKPVITAHVHTLDINPSTAAGEYYENILTNLQPITSFGDNLSVLGQQMFCCDSFNGLNFKLHQTLLPFKLLGLNNELEGIKSI